MGWNANRGLERQSGDGTPIGRALPRPDDTAEGAFSNNAEGAVIELFAPNCLAPYLAQEIPGSRNTWFKKYLAPKNGGSRGPFKCSPIAEERGESRIGTCHKIVERMSVAEGLKRIARPEMRRKIIPGAHGNLGAQERKGLLS